MSFAGGKAVETYVENQELPVVVRDGNRENKVRVCEDGANLTAERALTNSCRIPWKLKGRCVVLEGNFLIIHKNE